jgi:hypothetical protein
VVTMEKARKKTSQALRETKELKWLDIDKKTTKSGPTQKDVVCSLCKKTGHKTRIAKACLFHHQWLDAGRSNESTPYCNPVHKLNGTATAGTHPSPTSGAPTKQSVKLPSIEAGNEAIIQEMNVTTV